MGIGICRQLLRRHWIRSTKISRAGRSYQKIIETLGKIGPNAKEALPLLEDIGQDRGVKKLAVNRPVWSPGCREAAIEAIAKIKGAAPKKPDGGAKSSPSKSDDPTYDGK